MPYWRGNMSKDDVINQIRQQFIDGAGGIAVSLLGMLNRVCGQIYALLFLSPKPLSLDDIVSELRVSKGSVSINIRILEDYKLVKKVWVKGSRKDYYEATTTLPQKIIKEFFDKIKRNITDSLDMIDDCCTLATKGMESPKGRSNLSSQDPQFILSRLELIRSFYQGARVLFDAIYSGQKIDTSLIKGILS